MRSHLICVLTVMMISACASPQERAMQAPIPSADACAHLGEPDFLDRHRAALFSENGTDQIAFFRVPSGRLVKVRLSDIPERSQVVDKQKLETFIRAYREICGNNPPFYEALPIVMETQRNADKADEERRLQRQAKQQGEDERWKIEDERRDTAACNGTDMNACFRRAQARATGKGVTKDFDKALGLYAKACSAGVADACASLADVYRKGESVAIDNSKALDLYGKACNLDNANACFILGWLYEKGEVATKDPVRAKVAYSKGCDKGSGGACYNLGVMFNAGQGIPRDLALAVASFNKACFLKMKNGCDSYRTASDELQKVQDSSEQAQLIAVWTPLVNTYRKFFPECRLDRPIRVNSVARNHTDVKCTSQDPRSGQVQISSVSDVVLNMSCTPFGRNEEMGGNFAQILVLNGSVLTVDKSWNQCLFDFDTRH